MQKPLFVFLSHLSLANFTLLFFTSTWQFSHLNQAVFYEPLRTHICSTYSFTLSSEQVIPLEYACRCPSTVNMVELHIFRSSFTDKVNNFAIKWSIDKLKPTGIILIDHFKAILSRQSDAMTGEHFYCTRCGGKTQRSCAIPTVTVDNSVFGSIIKKGFYAYISDGFVVLESKS